MAFFTKIIEVMENAKKKRKSLMSEVVGAVETARDTGEGDTAGFGRSKFFGRKKGKGSLFKHLNKKTLLGE